MKLMISRKCLFISVFMLCARLGFGQLYYSKTAFIGFYSATPLEDIKGENSQAYAVIDIGKKEIAFTALVKGFIFPKELMQEHFNENYVESDKYPKTSFTGSYTGEVNVTRNGSYPVQVKGQLRLHDVVHPVEMPAVIEVKDGMLIATARFMAKPGDFHIEIPSVVRDKIAREITVNVKANCNPR
jgi:hypothetical protein